MCYFKNILRYFQVKDRWEGNKTTRYRQQPKWYVTDIDTNIREVDELYPHLCTQPSQLTNAFIDMHFDDT